MYTVFNLTPQYLYIKINNKILPTQSKREETKTDNIEYFRDTSGKKSSNDKFKSRPVGNKAIRRRTKVNVACGESLPPQSWLEKSVVTLVCKVCT